MHKEKNNGMLPNRYRAAWMKQRCFGHTQQFPAARTDQIGRINSDYWAISSMNKAMSPRLYGDDGHKPAKPKCILYLRGHCLVKMRKCPLTKLLISLHRNIYMQWFTTPELLLYGNEANIWYLWFMLQGFEDTLSSLAATKCNTTQSVKIGPQQQTFYNNVKVF